MTGSGQSHNFLDDKTNTGKGIVIMDRNTTKYKVKQYIMFAGISTVLFAAVVIIPFIYGLYLTLQAGMVFQRISSLSVLQIILQRLKILPTGRHLEEQLYILLFLLFW